MTEKKTYFVSDVHLGAAALTNNAEREKLFVRFLGEACADAHEIYLLGDVFDYWFEYPRVVPRGFTRTLGKLAEITDSGIPVHYFTGNHDLWVSDYLPRETGVILHRDFLVKQIGGKTFYLSHGDGLDPGDKSYLFLKRIFRSKTARSLFSLLHPDWAVGLGNLWAKKSMKDKNAEPLVKANPGDEAEVQFARKYTEKHSVDFFILGHRHLLLKKEIRPDCFLIYPGDWIHHFSYAVFDGNDVIIKKFCITT
ncbi:MAG TPA: UDP-2,3-diacylglucosamine diphosphatase [Prolixibacteraceae bacterium]|nr:UDP-2,3-diacylglucosamine diphosphatase [Prolixibacteraceae bacterium]